MSIQSSSSTEKCAGESGSDSEDDVVSTFATRFARTLFDDAVYSFAGDSSDVPWSIECCEPGDCSDNCEHREASDGLPEGFVSIVTGAKLVVQDCSELQYLPPARAAEQALLLADSVVKMSGEAVGLLVSRCEEDDENEDCVSVASFGSDTLEAEDEVASCLAADFVWWSTMCLHHAADSFESPDEEEEEAMEDILWQSVVCLPKCTRTAFRRRLVPRQAAPSITETPFPCDCLPLSPSVARSVPPCVEVETYENVDLGIFDALLAPSHRLSNEAWDTIRFRAADAFESLAVLAREEASRLIQQQWHRHAQVRALHAHRSSMSCCSVSASPVPVPPTTPSQVPRRRRRRVVDATVTTPLSAKPTAAVPERHDIVIDSPPLTSAATLCLPSNGSRVRHKVVPPVTPPGRVSRRSDTSEPGESSAAADDVDQSHPETCGSSFMTLDNCTFGLDRPLSTPVLQSGESLVADAVPATLRTEHLPPHFRSGSSRPIRGRLRTPRSRNACEDRAPLKLDRGSVLFAASAMLSDRGDGRKQKVGEPSMESDDTLPLFSGSGVALTQDQGRRVRRSKHVPPVVSAMELDLGISLGSSVSTSSTQVNTVKKPRRTKLALESDRPLTSDFARPQSREAPKISARTKAASFGRSLLDMDLWTSSDPSCVRPLSSDDAFRKHLSRKVSSPAASVGFLPLLQPGSLGSTVSWGSAAVTPRIF